MYDEHHNNFITMDSKLSMHSPPNLKTQLSIASNLDSQRSHQRPDKIQDLYSKFVSLNSQVTIDHDLSAFNLIQFHHKDAKYQYDKQMVLAKLKRLENNAELRRIDQQLQGRKKKGSKLKREYLVMPEKDKYINTYKDITQKKIDLGFENSDNHTDSDDDNAEAERPKGITYFHQLKRHPKLLQFTVEQAKSREKLKLEEINTKREKVEQFKNELKSIVNNRHKDWSKEKTANPERVAENIFRRFYARRNKEKSIQEARNDSRVSSFLDRQENIINTVDQRSLSKENYQKLKQRMNDIATEIYEDQKKHRSRSKLPKISVSRTTAFTTISK